MFIQDLTFSLSYQHSKEWAKKIQEEWRILENDLPGQCIHTLSYIHQFPRFDISNFLRFFSFFFPSLATEMIFVRAYESRMDLLRAVIIGAQGTPYHDGLFFFDIFFPDTYPSVPPVSRSNFFSSEFFFLSSSKVLFFNL